MRPGLREKTPERFARNDHGSAARVPTIAIHFSITGGVACHRHGRSSRPASAISPIATGATRPDALRNRPRPFGENGPAGSPPDGHGTARVRIAHVEPGGGCGAHVRGRRDFTRGRTRNERNRSGVWGGIGARRCRRRAIGAASRGGRDRAAEARWRAAADSHFCPAREHLRNCARCAQPLEEPGRRWAQWAQPGRNRKPKTLCASARTPTMRRDGHGCPSTKPRPRRRYLSDGVRCYPRLRRPARRGPRPSENAP